MIEIYNTSPSADKVVMEMSDKGAHLCVAEARIEGQQAEITLLADELPTLRYEMGKALLNALDFADVQEVVCKMEEYASILKALGFKPYSEGYSLSLKGYFVMEGKCHG